MIQFDSSIHPRDAFRIRSIPFEKPIKNSIMFSSNFWAFSSLNVGFKYRKVLQLRNSDKSLKVYKIGHSTRIKHDS